MTNPLHSFSFGAAYHNMSSPPRTKVDLARKPVSGRIVVFSFTWALSQSPLFRDRFSEISQEVRQNHVALSKLLPSLIKDPKELFAQIGAPTFPVWKTDFLIGFRILDSGDSLLPTLCEDPLLCAGVLSLCVGTLYLPRRSPDLSWERLLDQPVAFDDPIVILP